MYGSVPIIAKRLAHYRNIIGEQRVEEISRMLGGLKITGKTREHAREMLTSVTSYKS